MKFCVVLLLSAAAAVLAVDEEVLSLVNGQNSFTAALYKEVIKSKEGNFLISPFSIETVLALTQSGAKDETAAEIRQSLSLPATTEKTEKAFQALLPTLKGNEHYALHTANKVYVKSNYSINDSFKSIAKNVYQAGFENVNFAENVKAANAINSWVEQQTNNRIKDLIKSDSLSEFTRLVLVNALYFKGKWRNEFNTYATQKRDFYNSPTETTQVDTMSTTDNFNYYESAELDAKILELPYLGDDASMVIVLPNKKDGLAQIESQLEKALVRPEFTREYVHVQLPKFTIESTFELKPILEKLGIKRAFGSDADFSGIAGSKGDIYVSEVVQKTFINVTEDGTEAAAATAVVIAVPISAIVVDPTPPKQLIADQPFLVYISLKNVVLFQGRIIKF